MRRTVCARTVRPCSPPCTPRRAALAAALWIPLLLGACGGGAPDRPGLAGSFPAEGSVVPSGLSDIRLDFDEPVTLFLPQSLALRVDGVGQGVFLSQRPGEPRSVHLTPLDGTPFLAGAYQVDVLSGLVLNADSLYALEPDSLRFTVGGPPALFLAAPAPPRVHEVDGETFAARASLPTPGARAPVAVLPTRHGTDTRVYVQLASGGALHAPLAVFRPGDLAMQELALTLPPAGSLVAPSGALLLGPDGEELYAAYQESVGGSVRLVRVRVRDGVETGALTLARPGPSAPWQPGALVLRGDGQTLLVTQLSATEGGVSHVDLASFTELDRDAVAPGVQSQPLPFRPARADRLADSLVVASPDDAAGVLRTLELGSGSTASDASTQVGSPTSVLTTFEGRFVLEGLAALPGSAELLVVRSGTDLGTDAPLAVSDLLGLVSRASTRVQALARVPGARRIYVLLNTDTLARFSWDGVAVTQDDLDPLTDGVQAADLASAAPGATALGVLGAAYAD